MLEAAPGRTSVRDRRHEGSPRKKMVGMPQREQAVRYAEGRGLGQRRACELFGVTRSMLTYDWKMSKRDAPIIEQMNAVVQAHPTRGVRLVHGLLREQGCDVSFERLRRLYRAAGHAASWRKRSRKIRRGQRVDPVAKQYNEVWCMDFSEDRLSNGREFFSLLVKDEATSYGLGIVVRPSFKAVDVEAALDALTDRFGVPTFIRSDNCGQFIAFVIQRWAIRHNSTIAYIDPGKPWQNGFAESFVGTYRREVLNAELFHALEEADVLSQGWLDMYNNVRPHSRPQYRPPSTAYFTKQAA